MSLSLSANLPARARDSHTTGLTKLGSWVTSGKLKIKLLIQSKFCVAAANIRQLTGPRSFVRPRSFVCERVNIRATSQVPALGLASASTSACHLRKWKMKTNHSLRLAHLRGRPAHCILFMIYQIMAEAIADMSAPQHRLAGAQTCRLPNSDRSLFIQTFHIM